MHSGTWAAVAGCRGLQGDPQPYFFSRNNGQTCRASARPRCDCGQKPTPARVWRGATPPRNPLSHMQPKTGHAPPSRMHPRACTQAEGLRPLLVPSFCRGLLSRAPQCKGSFKHRGGKQQEELSFFPVPLRKPRCKAACPQPETGAARAPCPAMPRHASR